MIILFKQLNFNSVYILLQIALYSKHVSLVTQHSLQCFKPKNSSHKMQYEYQLIAGLQCHLRESGRPKIAFF